MIRHLDGLDTLRYIQAFADRRRQLDIEADDAFEEEYSQYLEWLNQQQKEKDNE